MLRKPISPRGGPNKKPEVAAGTPTPQQSARNAALRYVSDRTPGIRREADGQDFRYVDAAGHVVRAADTLARIKSLAIPPAWREVWICPLANGHLQATGRDARGRKQYRYHPAWRRERDATKYARMIAFGHALPRIRARVAHDLALPGMPKDKLLATIVRLLELTLIRVGNEEYARENRSYGLTTMRNRHVAVEGATVRFYFRGKSGKRHKIDVTDRRLARIVKHCRDLPGYELFEYVDDDGNVASIDSADVNDYLHAIAGDDFTAKDFRTWNGTVLAATALLSCAQFTSDAEAKRNVVDAVNAVSQLLGNTRAVCRQCYIHPAVIDCYLGGTLQQQLIRTPGAKTARRDDALKPEEAAVLAFLETVLAADAA